MKKFAGRVAGGKSQRLMGPRIRPIRWQPLDFRDPWGNRIEIVGYDDIQFTKAQNDHSPNTINF